MMPECAFKKGRSRILKKCLKANVYTGAHFLLADGFNARTCRLEAPGRNPRSLDRVCAAFRHKNRFRVDRLGRNLE